MVHGKAIFFELLLLCDISEPGPDTLTSVGRSVSLSGRSSSRVESFDLAKRFEELVPIIHPSEDLMISEAVSFVSASVADSSPLSSRAASTARNSLRIARAAHVARGFLAVCAISRWRRRRCGGCTCSSSCRRMTSCGWRKKRSARSTGWRSFSGGSGGG
jgi:hypothetical protein